MSTGLESNRLVRTLLAERLAADPGLRQVLPLLGLETPTPMPMTGTPTTGPTSDGAAVPTGSHVSRAELHLALAGIDDELSRVHTLLDRVGDAAGACRRCLGTEADCPDCEGHGQPGARQPDHHLRAWLLPDADRPRGGTP